MFVYRSNRMEHLVAALAQVVQRPLREPLQPEWIAVPSAGMERWLSMQLAQRLGVWANPSFPFPRKLIESAFAAVLGDAQASSEAYDPACLLFSVASLLRERAQDPRFAAVASYVNDDPNGRRRLQLAQRVADLFDQYSTYRPELLLGWQSAPADDWQAQLLRDLVERHGAGHIAARAAAFVQELAAGAGPVAGLPERVSLFGASTLPPLYVDLLGALSRRIEVHLFLLSPSREYYADARSAREIDAQLRRSGRERSEQLEALHLAELHPLLASLGRHGRELQEVLETRGGYREAAGDLYEDPGQGTLLHALQSDMLQLLNREAESADAAPRLLLDPNDASVAIHACHGPMREVEVLHDQLSALLQDPQIEPHDIIVMTPDIEAYAPVIDAVFSQTQGRPAIPFRLADRGALSTQAVAGALDALLDLLEGRLGSSRVLDVLGLPLVRERFEISADEVETLRQWVADSGIRWGADAAHRAQVEQPEHDANTWRFGLERLVLGYVMPRDDDALFLGRAPAKLAASEAQLLGRFLELCDTLFALRAELQTPCSVQHWQERIDRLLAALIVARADTAGEHKLVRRALHTLAQHASTSGFTEPIDIHSLRQQLARTLDARLPAHGFLSGGVTFCQLVPMRSIPFKVVCLLGMNDGSFPATDVAPSFDEMAKRPRVGDRCRRDDDRQLFLEALLSARERLLISYVGQSVHDGKALSPSVLVSELIDHITRSFQLPGEDTAAGFRQRATRMHERLLLRHPLQAFSPRYFGTDPDPRLFSYARGHCDGAARLLAQRQPRAEFWPRGAPAPSALPELRLSQLEAGLVHPLKMFARERLGLVLGDDIEQLPDREPLSLDNLERWQLGTELIERLRADGVISHAWPAFAARGTLPPGTLGVLEFRDVAATAAELVTSFWEHAQGQASMPLDFELPLGGVRLVGTLSQLWSRAAVYLQYSRLGTRHELRCWVRHLVLQCLRKERGGAQLPARSVLVGRAPGDGAAGAIAWGPIDDDPRAVLESLIEVFLLARTGPVPLLEHASRAFGEAIAKQLPVGEALGRARSAYATSSLQSQGDANDAYVSEIYRSWDEILAQDAPLSFIEAAQRVYLPMLSARESP